MTHRLPTGLVLGLTVAGLATGGALALAGRGDAADAAWAATLDRMASTLSGGEAQRIQLATSLGSRLVGTLYVLDEPSIGLHSRDTHRLIKILHDLRDLGNTILVVEHDPDVMRASDRILDLGPGAGESGGQVIAVGTYDEILKVPPLR